MAWHAKLRVLRKRDTGHGRFSGHRTKGKQVALLKPKPPLFATLGLPPSCAVSGGLASLPPDCRLSTAPLTAIHPSGTGEQLLFCWESIDWFLGPFRPLPPARKERGPTEPAGEPWTL
ncbi:hypothetical protein LY76DRAFT_141503 [Colletotrichum caudatum]|nr:hypothetical protein LY76DRAFT_141503 [Colletotrichum caudatum]